MSRSDHVDDPDAPRATHVVPSVVAVVADAEGRVLLVRRADSGRWALPGGGHEIGETIAETAVREVREETGYAVEVEALTGIYTDPRHIIAYDDGEVRQQFALAFRARLVGGEPRLSDESTDLAWVAPDDLDALDLHPSMRLRITHALDRGRAPYLG